MKRSIFKQMSFIIAVLLIAITVGCSSNSDASTNSDEYSGIVPIYTPGAGGIAYILSAGITNLFNTDSNMDSMQLATEATNGSADIMQFVLEGYEEGKPAFGALAGSTVSAIYEGTYEEIEGEHPEVQGVGFLSYTGLHIIVSDDSDINDFSDLENKKIAASPGAATTTLLMQLLEEQYGLGEDDYQYVPIDYDEIIQGLQNGSIDAGLINGAVPAPLVKEAESLTDVRVLSVGEQEMEEFLENHPYHGSYDIEAGTYENQEENITIPTLLVVYVTHEKSSDELVYNLVKTLLEKNDELIEIHPTGKDINEESILDGITIPLHPGAEKYYKEIGLID